MFVVQLSFLDDRAPDRKAFRSKGDAMRRFWAGNTKVVDGDLAGAAVFEVPDAGDDAPGAIAAVVAGHARLVQIDSIAELESIIDPTDLELVPNASRS